MKSDDQHRGAERSSLKVSRLDEQSQFTATEGARFKEGRESLSGIAEQSGEFDSGNQSRPAEQHQHLR